MAKAAKKPTGLGKGFNALLPQDFDDSVLVDSSDKVERLGVTKLVPNRFQPRSEFSQPALQELAESIKAYGILQPLVVAADDGAGGSNRYMIIAGERRWRAAKLAGLATVPAIIRSAEDLARLEIALIENVQRVDLSPLDQAASIHYLQTQFGTTINDIASRLGKAPSTVTNIVRLLQLPDEAAKALRDNIISEGHARTILALKPYPGKGEQLLRNIIKHSWTVRQAEQFVVGVKEAATKGDGDEAEQEAATKKRMRAETPATRSLSQRLHTPVFIRRTAKGGKLEVGFRTDEELTAILDILNGAKKKD